MKVLYKKRNLLLIFILIFSIIFFILKYEKDKKIKQNIDKQISQYILTYDAIYHQYKKRADIIFNTQINTNDTISLFAKRDRDGLLHSLEDEYRFLHKYNLKQLHFHLENNVSFLRFHRPKKYGDDLTNIRSTVAYVNKNKKSIDGFEEGRIFNGFRYVYPLFKDENHIGSVEISFSAFAFISEIIEHLNVASNFLILKEVVNQKVFSSEKSNYIKSNIKDFYFEVSIIEMINKTFPIEHKFLSKKQASKVSENIYFKKPFAIYDEKIGKLAVCIPISNPITKKLVAAIMIDGNTNYINNKILNFYIAVGIFGLFLALLFTVLYREINFRNKLNSNNKKLKMIIDEADSGIAIMDLDGNFLEVNNTYTKLLGYTQEEFKSLNCIDMTHKDFRFIALQILEDAKEIGHVSKVRKTCIAKDGKEVHLELSLNILPNNNSFVTVVNSLEDKIKIESALTRFEHIFNYTSVGFLIVDDKRDIVDVNKKLCQIFGYDKNKLIGQNARVLHIDDEHYKDYGDKVFVQAMSSELIRVEFEFIKQNKETIWCEISGSPMNKDSHLPDGGVLWAAVDISNKIEAQKIINRQNKKLQDLNINLNKKVDTQIQTLRDQDKILIQQSKMAAMGEMMDAVAHQWKQPLSVIKLSASELEYMNNDKMLTNDLIDEISKRIEKKVDYLVETIDEFRSFFRPKTDVENIPIKTIVDSALLLLKDEIIKNTIDVQFVGDILIKANLIPNEFKHVIINLINNSKDEFIRNNIKNRKIIIELLKKEDKIILKITDNAGGIPNEIIEDIFKANITNKKEDKGTGIGLYMTKNIIEKIEGNIEVDNTTNGACFKVILPCE